MVYGNTETIIPSTPNITLSGTVGNNGYYKSDVTVQITAGSDNISSVDKIRYSVSGAQTIEETTTQSGTTSVNVIISTDGTSSITAYIIDKAGNVSEGNTQIIKKDAIAPNPANIILSSTSAKGGQTFTATIEQVDNLSGIDIGASKWVLNTTNGNIGTDPSLYTDGTFNNTTQTINLRATVAGTNYLHVLSVDNAGNVFESTSEAIKVIAEPPVIVGNISLNRSANQLNVSVTAKDDNFTTLNYQLYVSPKGANNWQLKETKNNINQNTTVTLVASGLSSGTEYDCYVKASNIILGANSNIAQSNYCSGGEVCTWCDGYGEYCEGSCPNGHTFKAPPRNYRCPSCGRTNGCSLSYPKGCGYCNRTGRTSCSHGNAYSHYFQTNTNRKP